MSVDDPDKGRRQCLRCRRYFDSEWSGNRVCPRCTKRNSKLSCGVPSFDIDNSGYRVPPPANEVLLDGISNRSPNNNSHAALS